MTETTHIEMIQVQTDSKRSDRKFFGWREDHQSSKADDDGGSMDKVAGVGVAASSSSP